MHTIHIKSSYFDIFLKCTNFAMCLLQSILNFQFLNLPSYSLEYSLINYLQIIFYFNNNIFINVNFSKYHLTIVIIKLKTLVLKFYPTEIISLFYPILWDE